MRMNGKLSLELSTKVLVLLLCVCPSIVLSEDVQMNLDEALKRVDSPEYMTLRIEEASSIAWVRDAMLSTPEGQFLTSHCAEAVPRMTRNLGMPNGIRGQYTPIIYFVVFGVCKDPNVLPVLAGYLDSLSYTNDYKVLSEAYSYSMESKQEECGGFSHTHAFLYALDALKSLGVETPSPSSCLLFQERHNVAKAANAEFVRRTTTTIKASPQH